MRAVVYCSRHAVCSSQSGLAKTSHIQGQNQLLRLLAGQVTRLGQHGQRSSGLKVLGLMVRHRLLQLG